MDGNEENKEVAHMAHVIAVAGKGGVGKTTVCGLLIKYLADTGRKPILAIDADANSNLNEVLGIELKMTLGEIRETMKTSGFDPKSPIPPTMSKDIYSEKEISAALHEEEDYDLLVMGRSQGAGCYCFVNGLLQREMVKLENNYPYMVVDNEAGMEHISRGILPNIDTVVLVSDCSRRAVQAAGRIAGLIAEFKLRPRTIGLIVNRAPNGKIDKGTEEEIKKQNLNLLGIIPGDDLVYQYDCDGTPIIALPENSAMKQAVKRIADQMDLD